MPRGYSTLTVREIKEANQSLLGVRLGMICVAKQIPVADVADYLGVSRQAVYAWFRGKGIVSSRYVDKVQALLDKLV
jgi:transcriptional regulator with XRE-family HTH domain